eukprot:31199-Pelagococcus_subviridis.AAC.5
MNETIRRAAAAVAHVSIAGGDDASITRLSVPSVPDAPSPGSDISNGNETAPARVTGGTCATRSFARVSACVIAPRISSRSASDRSSLALAAAASSPSPPSPLSSVTSIGIRHCSHAPDPDPDPPRPPPRSPRSRSKNDTQTRA